MHNGRSAQRIVRGLDQGVFKGMNIVGWIGDNLKHGDTLYRLARAATHDLQCDGWQPRTGLQDRQRAKSGRFENLPYAATIKRAQWHAIGIGDRHFALDRLAGPVADLATTGPH
ncbi:hypothetical protein KAM380_043150 [Aeromonas caviae]|nr:hypothetical protein KAM380_043150 [Aeromonas caviae]